MSVRSVIAEVDFAEPARRGARRIPSARPSTASRSRGAEIESALLAGLAAQPGLGIAVCAPDGVLTSVNDALVEMIGHDPMLDAPFTLAGGCGLRDGDGREVRRGRDPLVRALKGESTTAEVFTVRDVAGRTIRALKCTTFPLLAADGTVLGAALVAVDVTGAETERRALEDLRAELVDTVNHEVRTPLAVIAGHMELIDEQPQPEMLSWSLRAIRRAAARLTTVVETMSEIVEESVRASAKHD